MLKKNAFIFIVVLLLFVSGAGRALAKVVVACPKSVAVGVPFAVRLTADTAMSDVSLTWLGKKVDVPLSSWNNKTIALTLLGSDVKYDQPGTQELVIRYQEDGNSVEVIKKIRIKKKKYPVQRLKVAKKMVNPAQESMGRIKKEYKEIHDALGQVDEHRYWKLPFAWPAKGRISSVYGVRRFFNGQPRSPHRGVDIAVGKGYPIRAVNDGRVALAGDFYFAGNTVYVDHGLGVYSMYCHLSKIDVKQGQMVEQGQKIGECGSTGRVTGPHLHLSVFILGKSVDPMPLLESGADGLLTGRK